MAAPLIPILVGVVAVIALAMSKKKSGTTAPSASGPGGIPSFPGAAGALGSAANQPPPPPTVGPWTGGPAAPPAFLPPSGGTITLPPITIGGPVAPPPVNDGTGAPIVTVPPVPIDGWAGGGSSTSALTAPWDSGSMVLPSPSRLPAIPAKYKTKSQETTDEQFSLNSWAAAVGFQGVDAAGNNLVPLAEDGIYGHDTQLAMAGFQTWVNATKNAGLAVDGLGGPKTQTYLLDWGDISSGAY